MRTLKSIKLVSRCIQLFPNLKYSAFVFKSQFSSPKKNVWSWKRGNFFRSTAISETTFENLHGELRLKMLSKHFSKLGLRYKAFWLVLSNQNIGDHTHFAFKSSYFDLESHFPDDFRFTDQRGHFRWNYRSLSDPHTMCQQEVIGSPNVPWLHSWSNEHMSLMQQRKKKRDAHFWWGVVGIASNEFGPK